jgi:hypothetical protein
VLTFQQSIFLHKKFNNVPELRFCERFQLQVSAYQTNQVGTHYSSAIDCRCHSPIVRVKIKKTKIFFISGRFIKAFLKPFY